jgi:hypothetical protein
MAGVVAAVTVTTRRSIKSPARGKTILDGVLNDIDLEDYLHSI